MKQLTPFIDAHVHGFLKPSDSKRFKDNISTLIDHGLEKILITALPHHDFNYELKISLAPQHIHPALTGDNSDETALLTAWTHEYGFQETVIPFVDVRFVTEHLRDILGASLASGFKGIKGAFIPEPDRVLAIQGIPQALGISGQRYLHIQHKLFSYAQELNLPILYHINLSQYFEWMCTVLEAFPRLRISIPHLGYSLRRITDILDRFEHTYTDPSYLIELLKKNNPRYRSFIQNYHTRILHGSDAIIVSSPPEEILSYAHYFSNLSIAEEMRNRILKENARTFLSVPA